MHCTIKIQPLTGLSNVPSQRTEPLRYVASGWTYVSTCFNAAEAGLEHVCTWAMPGDLCLQLGMASGIEKFTVLPSGSIS